MMLESSPLSLLVPRNVLAPCSYIHWFSFNHLLSLCFIGLSGWQLHPSFSSLEDLKAHESRAFIYTARKLMEENGLTVEDIVNGNYDRQLEHPVMYLSKQLNKHEQHYWSTELEIAGIVWAV
jgi:hypothetical protein